MGGIRSKLALAAAMAGFAFVLLPAPANATVIGGCTVTGSASVSGNTDLTTTAVWNLTNEDQVTGTAEYPTQTEVHIYVILFSFPWEIYTSSGKDTHGSAGPFKVSDYSKYTRIFAAHGTSDTCDGDVLIVVTDQSWFTTGLGLGGLIMAGIGAIILLLLLFAGSGSGGCGSIILGLLDGILLGVGAALSGTEAGIIDPRNIVGLIVIVVGIVIGAVSYTHLTLPTKRIV